MNRSVYLGLSILEISKTLMYEFWYNYTKSKYQQNAKLCYMDTDSFIIHIENEDVYEHIAEDVEKIFDTSNYEANRPLSSGKYKNVIWWINNKIGGKIKTKTYSYLMDHGNSDKKSKRTKKMLQKRILKFNGNKKCLQNNKIILKSQERF